MIRPSPADSYLFMIEKVLNIFDDIQVIESCVPQQSTISDMFFGYHVSFFVEAGPKTGSNATKIEKKIKLMNLLSAKASSSRHSHGMSA